MAKKYFAPGTFIPKPQRILAIIHLCLVFTFVMWAGGYPFMGELFSLKARKLVYESVIKDSAFSELPYNNQKNILNKYNDFDPNTSFFQKISNSIRIVAFTLSPFTRFWILLSIIIPILCLMKIEGAAQASWLLPLVVLLFAWDNHLHGYNPTQTHEMRLFPSEEVLIRDYLMEEPAIGIWEQKEQLERGWVQYIEKNWGGQFGFNLARLKAMQKDGLPNPEHLFRKKEPFVLYLVYILWNFAFAFMMQFHTSGSRAHRQIAV